MPSELGGRREIDLLRHNNIPSGCNVYTLSQKPFPSSEAEVRYLLCRYMVENTSQLITVRLNKNKASRKQTGLGF